MGLLRNAIGNVTGALGLSGSQSAGGAAQADLSGIAARLRGFKPVRVRSILGDSAMDENGLSFTPSGAFAQNQHDLGTFFGNSARDLAAFSEGDEVDRVLSLLRQKRATLFDSNLSRLESRLLQQGRLGLGTGERGANPELAGFFGAEADADLNAQLAAREEARRTGSDLLQRTAAGFGLFQATANPDSTTLFNLANLNLARDVSAANIEAGGSKFAFEGAKAEQDTRAGFFGGIIQAVIGGATGK